ncbi:uncharacterized protein LOC130676491 [Microplitis mediator]|uniref:uncharacterized protein LOC130676491 n=1 Tax=Microplitis mediator TaxID=375433 RepID=UPI0025557DC8|nr:uncharacterized protein LOC130676491 [Microplitis mediator]
MPYVDLNSIISNLISFDRLNLSPVIDRKFKKKRFVPNILKKQGRSEVVKQDKVFGKISPKVNRRKQNFFRRIDQVIGQKMNENIEEGLDQSPMWYVGDTDDYLQVQRIEIVDEFNFNSPEKITDVALDECDDRGFFEFKNLTFVDDIVVSGLEFDDNFQVDNNFFITESSGRENKDFYIDTSEFEFDFIDSVEASVKNEFMVLEFDTEMLENKTDGSIDPDPSKFEYQVIDNFEEYKKVLKSSNISDFKAEVLLDPLKISDKVDGELKECQCSLCRTKPLKLTRHLKQREKKTSSLQDLSSVLTCAFCKKIFNRKTSRNRHAANCRARKNSNEQ